MSEDHNGTEILSRERRIGVFQVSPDLLCLLGVGTFRVVENPLPSDYKIIGCGYDWAGDFFWVKIESDELDVVEEGARIPFIEPPKITKLDIEGGT